MVDERYDARLWREDGQAARGNGAATSTAVHDEPSLGDLFRQLSTDTSDLVRQEMQLAKAELRETSAHLARDAARMGMAAGLALAGALTLTAFLVIALGALFGGHYWLSALIVGVVLVGVAAWLWKGAMADIKHHGITPTQTIASLRNDATWAQRQAKEFKQELRS